MVALWGFAFGFLGSVPVAGPISALVFSRAARSRYTAARGVAAGGAVAETFYAFVAFWGLSHLLDEYPMLGTLADGITAMILLGLSVVFLRTPLPSEDAEALVEQPGQWRSAFALGFGVTALNPTVLGMWSAATAMLLSLGGVRAEPAGAAPFALAAGFGVYAWFAVLVRLVARFRERFSPLAMRRFIQSMGMVLLGSGTWFGYRAVVSILGFLGSRS